VTTWGPLLTPPTPRGRNLARAAQSVGVGIRWCESEEELADALEEAPDFAIVNVEGDDGAALFSAFLRLSGRPLARRTILYADLHDEGEFLALLEADLLYHLIAPSSPGSLDRVASTVAKLFSESPFGLERYLPWGTRVGSLPLTKSSDKEVVLERLSDFASAMGVPSRLSALACAVADEFVMNALYDAPTDERGHPLFAERPRSEPVELPEGHRARFQFACTGTALVVASFDPYGSLRPETVRSNLRRTLTRGDDQIRRGSAGAGMGLFMAFQSLSDWIINLVPSLGTEMIGLVRTTGTFRDHAATPKSLHLFVP
jgi:hypothetical protein